MAASPPTPQSIFEDIYFAATSMAAPPPTPQTEAGTLIMSTCFDSLMQTTNKLSRMLETLITKANHQQELLNNICEQSAATASAMESVTSEAATAMANIAHHHRIQVENYKKAARAYDAEQRTPTSASARSRSVPPPPTPTAYRTTPPHLKIIVAACWDNKGIGFCGGIPWHLPQDTAHFKEMTTATRDPKSRNAVIMGRKTWDSIPQRFRPLTNRLNIVLSRRLCWPAFKPLGAEAVLSRTLAEAVEVATAARCESIFIAGGAELYKEVMTTYRGPLTLYLTTVLTSFTCDVFIPDPIAYSFYRVTPRGKNLLKSNKLHDDIYYRFEVWHKGMTEEENEEENEEEKERDERDECEAVPNNDFHWPQ